MHSAASVPENSALYVKREGSKLTRGQAKTYGLPRDHQRLVIKQFGDLVGTGRLGDADGLRGGRIGHRLFQGGGL